MPGKKLVAPFAEEEYSLDLTRQNLVNWNLLYQQALPLSFPFIIPHATWKEKEYYIHHCPANISAEIVLEGSLQFTLEDGTRILRANELIFLPIGEPNRICTGAEGFTRKAVFGIRGFLADPILASFSLESGKIYRLQDPARILQMLSHLVTLYRKQDPALLNRASAAAFEILLEIRDQICEKSANIASGSWAWRAPELLVAVAVVTKPAPAQTAAVEAMIIAPPKLRLPPMRVTLP